ncbi:cytochrome P450 81D11-like [Camellia sinensis]|nr:cytochrome P450 81D11-like [Camellia sinensis]
MTTRLVASDRCVRDEDAGTELGKRFVEGLKEKFLRSSPSNLCDYVPILRWIDYGRVKKSMVILQKKRDEFLQGLIDQKARTEIDNQVGHRCLLDDSNLSKLPFLQCVINETLRLSSPVPLLLPHYSSEDCIVGGFEVPRGTTLLVNALGLHRDPKVWEEPDKFKPERFEGGREGFKFVPFGIGRRACPGANMGVRAISLALGLLIQCFELEQVREKKSLIIDSKPPLKAEALEVVCIPRKNALELLSQFQN